MRFMQYMPRQGRVTSSPSGFGRFLRILARQCCIDIGTKTIPATGVKDRLGRSHRGRDSCSSRNVKQLTNTRQAQGRSREGLYPAIHRFVNRHAAKEENMLEKLTAVGPPKCHHSDLGKSGRGGTYTGEGVIAIANLYYF